MLRGVSIIFRKEFLDILRDRKTLIFMLMIPMLAMPLLIVGISRLVQSIQQAQEVEPVVVVADEQSREAYLQLAHTWFLSSQMGKSLQMLDSPFLKALVKPEEIEQFGDVPAGVTKDPAAFREWAKTIAAKIKDNLDSYEAQQAEEVIQLSEVQRREIVDFYRVVVKGVALVDFAEPSTVDKASDEFDIEHIPEDLRGIPNIRRIANVINNRDAQAVLQIPQPFGTIISDDQAELPIVIYYDSTISLSNEAFFRISDVANAAGRQIVYQRLEKRNIRRAFAEPVVVEPQTNLASTSKLVLTVIGSLLPYLVIIFAFLGAIYPSVDLGAGEKERQTLETLLLSPVSRTQIAVGKFCVILMTSLIAALLGLTSLTLSVKFLVPQAILDSLELKIKPEVGFLIALMAIPVAAAFAGILLAISIFARSFKEAQNYMAPLQFVLIVPAMAPLLPGVEMNWKIAFIPLVNVAILTREFLKGDVNWGYYAATLFSCLFLAALCLAYCVRQFNREKVLFRS